MTPIFKKLLFPLSVAAGVLALTVALVWGFGTPAQNHAAIAKLITNDARMVSSAANQWWAENAKPHCSLKDTRQFIDYDAPQFPAAHRWLRDHHLMPASFPWPMDRNTATAIRLAAWRAGHADSNYIAATDPRANTVTLTAGGHFALCVPGFDRTAPGVPPAMSAQRQAELNLVVFECDTGAPAAPELTAPTAGTKPPGRP